MICNCQGDVMMVFQTWWIYSKSSSRMQDGSTRIFCGGFWKEIPYHTASSLVFQEVMRLPTSFSAGGQRLTVTLGGLATTSDLLRLMKVRVSLETRCLIALGYSQSKQFLAFSCWVCFVLLEWLIFLILSKKISRGFQLTKKRYYLDTVWISIEFSKFCS